MSLWSRNVGCGIAALSTLGCQGRGAEDPVATSFPESCAEIVDLAVEQTGEPPENGTYTLYVNGDESMPWDAYCHDMNRSEQFEFLSVDETDNFSEVVYGDQIATTTYRRLRIDPVTLEINPFDVTFADTDQEVEEMPEGLSDVPAGWAQFNPRHFMDLGAAMASVDLSGTAFVFSEDLLEDNFFCTVVITGDTGDTTGSGATMPSDRASLELTAINTLMYSETRTVADCNHLTDDWDVSEGWWPLEYVGAE